MATISFFELEPFQKRFFEEQLKDHTLIFDSKPLTKRNAKKHEQSEIVVVFILSKIDDDVIARMPNLKFITTMSTGFDHIDLEATQENDIKVSRVPVYGQNTVAEHAFTLLQTLNRHIVEAVERTRKGLFEFKGLMGRDLAGKTIGIVGTGNIGVYMIKYAKAFDMKIVAYDAFKKPELAKEYGFTYVGLNELCKKSDFISLHVPLLDSTYHMLSKEQFKLMKKGVIIVNTGRGPLIDTPALISALDKKIVKGAALDVLELEGDMKNEVKIATNASAKKKQLATLLENHNLLDRENVLVTPHLAFYTEEALMRILKTTKQNITGHLNGKYKNVVG